MITDSTTRFIDVSKWQHPTSLHWDKLPSDISAVVVRTTYGKTPDPFAKAHFDAALNAKRKAGVYHFVTYDAPETQWHAFSRQCELLGFGCEGDVLPVLDCELLPKEKTPADPARYLSNANKLAALCDSAFGGCIIYTAASFWQMLGRPRNWLERPLWVAHYPSDRSEAGARAFADKVLTPHGPGAWRMWQSGPRLIPGFSPAKIDYNYSLGELPVT